MLFKTFVLNLFLPSLKKKKSKQNFEHSKVNIWQKTKKLPTHIHWWVKTCFDLTNFIWFWSVFVWGVCFFSWWRSQRPPVWPIVRFLSWTFAGFCSFRDIERSTNWNSNTRSILNILQTVLGLGPCNWTCRFIFCLLVYYWFVFVKKCNKTINYTIIYSCTTSPTYESLKTKIRAIEIEDFEI